MLQSGYHIDELIEACNDHEHTRYTRDVFRRAVYVSNMQNNKIFNNYESFIVTVAKLQLRCSWKSLAVHMAMYGIGDKDYSTWRRQSTKFLREWTRKNKLLNPEERWCNELERLGADGHGGRVIFPFATMITDAVPCYCKRTDKGGPW